MTGVIFISLHCCVIQFSPFYYVTLVEVIDVISVLSSLLLKCGGRNRDILSRLGQFDVFMSHLRVQSPYCYLNPGFPSL